MALLVWIPVIGDISNVALGFYKTKRTHTFILMFIGRMCRFLLWTLLFLIFSSRFIKFFDKLLISNQKLPIKEVRLEVNKRTAIANKIIPNNLRITYTPLLPNRRST